MAATNDDIVNAINALAGAIETSNRLLAALTAEMKQGNEYLEHIQMSTAFPR
jgi:hypothetical protein